MLRLAELNRSGTQLAIRATATATAFEYACAGLEALARAEPQMWSVHHRLAFELALDRASAYVFRCVVALCYHFYAQGSQAYADWR